MLPHKWEMETEAERLRKDPEITLPARGPHQSPGSVAPGSVLSCVNVPCGLHTCCSAASRVQWRSVSQATWSRQAEAVRVLLTQPPPPHRGHSWGVRGAALPSGHLTDEEGEPGRRGEIPGLSPHPPAPSLPASVRPAAPPTGVPELPLPVGTVACP